jgi:hypothetical protein
MVSTTGEHAAHSAPDADLTPQKAPMPEALQPWVNLMAKTANPRFAT